jgi:hypothetical protein
MNAEFNKMGNKQSSVSSNGDGGIGGMLPKKKQSSLGVRRGQVAAGDIVNNSKAFIKESEMNPKHLFDHKGPGESTVSESSAESDN